MSVPLIILDRDGVINYDSDDYIKKPEEWIAINSSLIAIAKLTQAGYTIVIATNQSGLSRGLFSQDTLNAINSKMLRSVEENGGIISAIEFCPDHPDRAGPNRKPAPGMLLKLLKQFNAKAKETWFVGDTISDVYCALNAGCKPALVLTGKGEHTILKDEFKNINPSIPVYKNLLSFTESLLSKNNRW